MKTLVVAGAIAFLSFCGMTFYLRDLAPSVLHAQLTFSSSGFEGVVGRWSPEMLERFRRHFVVDYGCIAAYSLFGAQLGRLLVRRLQQGRAVDSEDTRRAAATSDLLSFVLPWALPSAGACDVIENTLELLFLAARPRLLFEPAYLAAGVAAAMKFALFGLFSLAAIRTVMSTRKVERTKPD